MKSQTEEKKVKMFAVNVQLLHWPKVLLVRKEHYEVVCRAKFDNLEVAEKFNDFMNKYFKSLS